MEVLTYEDVMVIRSRLATTTLAQQAFGAVEPLSVDLLASAVGRQTTGFGDQLKYSTPEAVAATLFYGIGMNHAFENGNKRTALVSMLVLLDKNKLWLVDTSEDELFDLATLMADHELRGGGLSSDEEVDEIARWIRDRTRATEFGQRRMRFRDLRQLLEEHGCTFDNPHGNFIKIRRVTADGEHAYKAGYPNEHHEVPVNEIRKIRRALQLDRGSGYDAGAFYDLEERVDGFVNNYRQLMNRLADY